MDAIARIKDRREAFRTGWRKYEMAKRQLGGVEHPTGRDRERIIELLYPLPFCDVPRIEKVGRYEFRVVNGVLQYNSKTDGWTPMSKMGWRVGRDDDESTKEQVLAWARLYARPTESKQIEDEEDLE